MSSQSCDQDCSHSFRNFVIAKRAQGIEALNTRSLQAWALLLAPGICFASDPTGLLFLFTIPFLLVSVATAFAIAGVSKSSRGYAGLVAIALLNLLPGIFLTMELLSRERDFLPGVIHGAAYCLLLVPFKMLHRRLNPNRQSRH